MNVMIVDDDRVSSLILKRTLDKLGFGVRSEKNGSDAWASFQHDPVSIIIADWVMPGIDGMELCRRVRQHAGVGYTYFIILTAKSGREDRIVGLRSGADDYMVKPMDAAELEARLVVARRILAMHDEITQRSEDMSRLHAELAQQNENLADAMTYLTHANRRFGELFEGLPTACYSWDSDGRIHEWNRAAVEMFGYQPQEVMERHTWDVFRDPDAERQADNVRARKELAARIFAGERIVGLELVQRNKRGKRLHLLSNMLPIRTNDGSITGAITALIDITDRRRLEQRVQSQLRVATRLNAKLERQRRQLAEANALLADLAVTDGLTGLKNHRHFREHADLAFSFAARHFIPFSIIMADVDNFKQFNDTFGHLAGDSVLRTVADRLRDGVRAHDLVARYGGEEFVILCPATDMQGGRDLAQRLRRSIECHPWTPLPVTASFGVSTFYPGVSSASALVDEADRALYRSKADGRNCVTHYLDIADRGYTPPPPGERERNVSVEAGLQESSTEPLSGTETAVRRPVALRPAAM